MTPHSFAFSSKKDGSTGDTMLPILFPPGAINVVNNKDPPGFVILTAYFIAFFISSFVRYIAKAPKLNT